jgi:hypothetical protein
MRQPGAISFDLAKARETVRKAKRALKEAEQDYDEHCGVGANVSLIDKVRRAERRLEEARATLRGLDPRAGD